MHRHRTARSLTALTGLLALAACGTAAREGDCGSELSTAECHIVRTQLGPLPKDIPVDPTNGLTNPASSRHEDARLLGQALFFDVCLSENGGMSCATCHQTGAALADATRRELKLRIPQMNGSVLFQAPVDDQTANGPLNASAKPLVDPQGYPLAVWKDNHWEGVMRRTQTSPSANSGKAHTGHNTPTLYNLPYGAGAPATDGDRRYGVVWTPLDGRYDSVWALSAEVYEFGGVQRTNRTYLSRRIFDNAPMKDLYERVFGAMPRMDELRDGLQVYPRNASPATGFNADWVNCWNNGMYCPEANRLKLPLDTAALERVTQVLANAGKALGVYMGDLRSNQSRYDKFVGYWTRAQGSNADVFVAADPSALSVSEQRGLRLFIGKAQCIRCHSGPNFTDWRFHNLGVPIYDSERRANGSSPPKALSGTLPGPLPVQCGTGSAPTPECPDQGRYAWQNRLSMTCPPGTDGVLRGCQNSSALACGSKFNQPGEDRRACLPTALFDSCAIDTSKDMAGQQSACEARPGCAFLTGAAPMMPAVSRCVPRSQANDLGAFKTPSLRNVGKTWPYMHNGAIADLSPDAQAADEPAPHLRKVVEFYNEGGGTPVIGARDPVLQPLLLTRAEISDLVDFLKTLTDDTVGTRPEEKQPQELLKAACP